MSYIDDVYDADYEQEVMQGSVDVLAENLVGQRIVSVERTNVPEDTRRYGRSQVTVFTLANGKKVNLYDTDDCCAFTEVESFKFLENVDNAITRVEASDGFSVWHIYAENIPVATLDVEWSPGNPYYYGFGFEVQVED